MIARLIELNIAYTVQEAIDIISHAKVRGIDLSMWLV